ncbi:uncharacterized protein LOC110233517 [Exaiptasia diaphana]|uniref:UPAR/Ly6 domain-containing protein n=1 Tax=Exaiptasia diaphana TaxID=2652724 RepID=A0A913WUV1_EXADI|nr:uncharacterized protein LOC110233517 [Exaiptasia diaphana]KXJ06318.1 hypothetical protein AC249_AIPGENE6502 [Exaiptasia diaphana]
MRFQVAVVMIVVAMQTGLEVKAIKCYECASTKDWETCNKAMTENTCYAGVNSCMKTKIYAEGTSYAEHLKLCSNACTEEQIPLCNKEFHGVKYKCEINCCKDDLCNEGSAPVISGFLIMICALLSGQTFF